MLAGGLCPPLSRQLKVKLLQGFVRTAHRRAKADFAVQCSFVAVERDDRNRAALSDRIGSKIADYDRYKFTAQQARALNIFFDLAQEYEDICYLYHLPVEVLRLFFGMPAELYIRDDNGFCLRTSKLGPPTPLPGLEDLSEGPVHVGLWWFFPARGRADATVAPPVASGAESGGYGFDMPDDRRILAVLALCPEIPLTEHDLLYYEKFSNRLGFCLHNRLLAQKNKEHIQFVRNLVHDIGHNVIAPNLYFKLLIRQMAGMITALDGLAADLAAEPTPASVQSLRHLHTRIEEQYQEITRHFQQSSFFLETLLRQSHFEQGQYVLQRSFLDIVRRVVEPQLERYRVRFQEKGIRVEEAWPDGETSLMVEGDRGLLSQVMANLFSNAVKYTRESSPGSGMLMRCTVSLISDYFGKDKSGVRVAVLTSGRHIDKQEALMLFTESFRASNTDGEYGSGHGLHFIELIMRQHHGDAGYAARDEGNEFYLTLPRSTEDA